jgi:hypothetical protein
VRAGGVTPSPLTITLFSSRSVDISFEDDVPVILLLGISLMFGTESVFNTIMEPRNRLKGMNSTSLCSLADRYYNPIPTRFLASIDCLKIPAQLTADQFLNPSLFALKRLRIEMPDPGSILCTPEISKYKLSQARIEINHQALHLIFKLPLPWLYCTRLVNLTWGKLKEGFLVKFYMVFIVVYNTSLGSVVDGIIHG